MKTVHVLQALVATNTAIENKRSCRCLSQLAHGQGLPIPLDALYSYSSFKVDGTDPMMSFRSGPFKPLLGVCVIYSQSTISFLLLIHPLTEGGPSPSPLSLFLQLRPNTRRTARSNSCMTHRSTRSTLSTRSRSCQERVTLMTGARTTVTLGPAVKELQACPNRQTAGPVDVGQKNESSMRRKDHEIDLLRA